MEAKRIVQMTNPSMKTMCYHDRLSALNLPSLLNIKLYMHGHLFQRYKYLLTLILLLGGYVIQKHHSHPNIPKARQSRFFFLINALSIIVLPT